MGGPSVQQFHFKHDHSPVYDYARYDPDAPGNSRRSVYRFVVRSVPDPFMDALDCPDPSLLTPRRNVTTTALQALAMLNDPFVCQAGRPLCRATGARREETTVACGSGLSAHPRASADAATKRRLLTDYVEKHGLANFCRVLFNSNEFMFVD